MANIVELKYFTLFLRSLTLSFRPAAFVDNICICWFICFLVFSIFIEIFCFMIFFGFDCFILFFGFFAFYSVFVGFLFYICFWVVTGWGP